MKVAKIIPKTIPILILLREKHKIWCKIGRKSLYLVVLGGYAYTLGGSRYIHLTTGRFLRFESYFTIQKIQILYHNTARFESKTQYIVTHIIELYCI